MNVRAIAAPLAAATLMVTLAACGGGSSGSGGKTFTVGIVNSYSGPIANFGPAWEDGFRVGIDSLTDGTGEVDGVKIVMKVKNDNADPATGVSATKELLGEGVRLIVGTSSSAVVAPVAQLVKENDGVFIAGVTNTPAINGLGQGIFRAGPGVDLVNAAVIATVIADKADSLMYLGQDYALGQDAAKSFETLGKPKGITVDKTLLPPSTQDFTAGVAKALAKKPKAMYIGWSGAGQSQLYNALADQGAFKADSPTKVIVVGPITSENENLAKSVGEDALPNLQLISMYGAGTSGTAAEKDMLERLKNDKTPIDLQQPSGYLTAQMVVKALKEAGPDFKVADVNKALSGATFDSAFGDGLRIRPEDHVLEMPVSEYRLVNKDGRYSLTLKKAYPPSEIVPPVTKTIK